MTVYISLLRGINVSGQKKVKMAELSALYETLGLDSIKTYVQSGNVVFQSDQSPGDLSDKIHAAIEKQFGFSVEVLVRSLDDWRALVERSPFAGDGDKDPKYLHITLLAQLPDKQAIAELEVPQAGADEYRIDGQAVYLHCPNGYGRTKLNNNFWEKKLKVGATTRNWNTVNKLLELAEAVAAS